MAPGGAFQFSFEEAKKEKKGPSPGGAEPEGPESGGEDREKAEKGGKKGAKARPSLWRDEPGVLRESKGDLIDIGSGSSCSIVSNDTLVQEQHAVLRWREGRFYLQDLGTATGTYVNGLIAAQELALADGDEVVLGATRIRLRLADEHGRALQAPDGRPMLQIQLQENAFFFAKKSGKLFAKLSEEERRRESSLSTRDQLVYAETRFARSRWLRAANWAAVTGALLLPLSLWTSHGKELVNPGPISDKHVQALREKGMSCEACHAPFSGPSAERCGGCHPEILEPSRHPVKPTVSVAASVFIGDCATCHREHQGPVMPERESKSTCFDCHAAAELQPEAMTAALARRDERIGVECQNPPRPVELAYNEFSHASHLAPALAIACSECHGEPASGAREFVPVQFETCQTCHAQDPDRALARWPKANRTSFGWNVTWHGSEEASKCLQCHRELHQAPLNTDQGVAASPSAFLVQRRGHEEFLERPDDPKKCARCHASGEVPSAMVEEVPFWHGTHLPELFPADAQKKPLSDAHCSKCHSDTATSSKLATLSIPGATPELTEHCGTCHRDEARRPLSVQLAAPGSPVPSERGTLRDVMRTRTDFPHDQHLTLPGGCFECHFFPSAESAQDTPLRSKPETIPDPDCRRCHSNHQNIAGGACAKCHGFEPRWQVDAADARAYSAWRHERLLKDWRHGGLAAAEEPVEESASAFSHLSPAEHETATYAGQCVDCHAESKQGQLAVAETVLQVPIPQESDPGCRKCHVIDRRRVHWE